MTLSIVDANRAHVRTLVGPVARKRGPGRNDVGRARRGRRRRSGRRVPDARRSRLPDDLHAEPDPRRHDAAGREAARTSAPRVLEPGSRLKVRYLLNEPARVSVFLDGRRVLLGRSSRLKWKVEWQARARPGKHRVTVTARDAAGNLSDATRPVVVVVPLRVLTTQVSVRPSRALRRAHPERRARLLLAARRERQALRARACSGFARRSSAGHYRLVIRQDRVAHVVPVVVTRATGRVAAARLRDSTP